MQRAGNPVVVDDVVLDDASRVLSNQDSDSSAAARAQVDDLVMVDVPGIAAPVRHRLNRVEEGIVADRDAIDSVAVDDREVRGEREVFEARAIGAGKKPETL
jgi:hypothetical protein